MKNSKLQICFSVALIAIFVFTVALSACALAPTPEEKAPPEEVAPLPEEKVPPNHTERQEEPDPHLSPSTPIVKYQYIAGIMIGATIHVNVENTGGAGLVELILKIQNQEIGRKVVYLESGEKGEVSFSVGLSRGTVWGGGSGEVSVRPGEKVSFTVTASPVQFDIDSLIRDLKQGDLQTRQDAAIMLGEIKDEKAVEPLIQALKDEDWLVGRKAADALGKIGGEKAVEALIQALNDEDLSEVHQNAILALGEIGDEGAVEAIIPFLEHHYAHIRWSAAEALGEIGDARAVEPLTKVAEDKGEEDWVRESAEKALEKIKG